MSLFSSSSSALQAEPAAPTTPAGDDLSAQSSVIWVNLRDYGFKKAGALLGHPQGLANLFDQIRQGFVLDENTNTEKQRAERTKIDAEIGQAEGQITEHRTEIRRIEQGEIRTLEMQHEQLAGQIRDIELQQHRTEKGPNDVNRFNLILYWSIFIPTTLFLYCFYVSTFYSAFFRNLTSEASQDGADIDSILSAIFSPAAFTTLNFHFAAPIMFFVFGVVLHVMFDQKGAKRWPLTLGVLVFILLVDGLLAYSLEHKIQAVRVLMRQDDPNYFFLKSSIFYVVLALGFCTCLGWSVILHEIRAEHAKFDVDGLRRAELKQKKSAQESLQTQVQAWRAKIVVIEGSIAQLENQIEQLRTKREAILLSLWDLRKRIADFYDGWLGYIVQSGRNQDALLKQCDEVYQAFCRQYVHSATPTIGPVLAQA
jgi:TolA-binding protein